MGTSMPNGPVDGFDSGATVIDPAVAGGFIALRDALRAQLPAKALAQADALQAALPDWRRTARFSELGAAFAAAVVKARQLLPHALLVDMNRLLVTQLALGLDTTLHSRRLTPELLSLVPAAAARLLAHLRDGVDAAYVYPSDYFVKDLRFAAGLTVPGGAEVLDLRSHPGQRVSMQLLRRRPSLASLRALLSGSRFDPWFRIHTEKRYLRHFHEPGWDVFYRRVAGLLVQHPQVRGVVGTAWFFDPQLDAISPRLGYLRNPLARGAFLVAGKTSEFDIVSATTNSQARTQLYEQGRYTPVPHTLVWPREALLRWADARGPDTMSERLVLNLHGIGAAPPGVPDAERRYWCSVSRFEALLDSLPALVSEAGLPIEITFDDGNLSDATIALTRAVGARPAGELLRLRRAHRAAGLSGRAGAAPPARRGHGGGQPRLAAPGLATLRRRGLAARDAGRARHPRRAHRPACRSGRRALRQL